MNQKAKQYFISAKAYWIAGVATQDMIPLAEETMSKCLDLLHDDPDGQRILKDAVRHHIEDTLGKPIPQKIRVLM